MQQKEETPATVLVALMPEVKDWALLQKENWYRIPQDNAPPIILNGQAKYIAFYHTAIPQNIFKKKTKSTSAKRCIKQSGILRAVLKPMKNR